ncbi:MAG TPA: regulatory protein RecX [Vicinamibacterales bacterium]|jgi:regulatory protein|nr:regulatory protein RecX [Vicinamibacterales bacterium]
MRFLRAKAVPDARGPLPDAYLVALRMLARRELSEAQIRERLARREYDDEAIDTAVARLKQERAIDDERVAGAIARTATSIKRRGRVRVKRDLQNAGIPSSAAKKAIDETFGEVDEDALLATTLSRRLRGGSVVDRAGLSRLYRYLRNQGFDHDRVMKHLRRLKPGA